MAGSKPAIASRGATPLLGLCAGEILDSLKTYAARRWHPAKIAGALRFVSLVLHILSQKGERRRRHVSARKASELDFNPETYFFNSPAADFHATAAKTVQHTASLDELAEPNYYNKRCTHRQLAFAHPTFGA